MTINEKINVLKSYVVEAQFINGNKINFTIAGVDLKALIATKVVSGVFYSELNDSDSIVMDTKELSFIKYSLWDDCDEY